MPLRPLPTPCFSTSNHAMSSSRSNARGRGHPWQRGFSDRTDNPDPRVRPFGPRSEDSSFRRSPPQSVLGGPPSGFRPSPRGYHNPNYGFYPAPRGHQNPGFRPRSLPRPADFREWVSSSFQPPPHCERFKVVSYNILADYLARDHRLKLYSHIPPRVLDWEWRKRRILVELGLWSPDIMCLQEVDRFGDLEKELDVRGYRGIWKMRTGHAIDGCAIFWRVNRFHLRHEESIEFNKLGLRDNVAQICVLESRAQGRVEPKSAVSSLSLNQPHGANQVVVCNIHVLYNPKRGEIKLGQIRVLLDRAFSVSRLWHNAPVIICGDFNTTPKSSLYNFISEQKLDLSGLARDHVSGQYSASIRIAQSYRGRGLPYAGPPGVGDNANTSVSGGAKCQDAVTDTRSASPQITVTDLSGSPHQVLLPKDEHSGDNMRHEDVNMHLDENSSKLTVTALTSGSDGGQEQQFSNEGDFDTQLSGEAGKLEIYCSDGQSLLGKSSEPVLDVNTEKLSSLVISEEDQVSSNICKDHGAISISDNSAVMITSETTAAAVDFSSTQMVDELSSSVINSYINTASTSEKWLAPPINETETGERHDRNINNDSRHSGTLTDVFLNVPDDYQQRNADGSDGLNIFSSEDTAEGIFDCDKDFNSSENVNKDFLEELLGPSIEENEPIGLDTPHQTESDLSSTQMQRNYTYNPYLWTPSEIEAASGNAACTLVEHNLNLKSSYTEVKDDNSTTRYSNGEPQVTSYNRQFMGTVDYIWCSEGVRTVKVLETIRKDVLQLTPGFPTPKWGSDHLAIACEFVFTKGTEHA